MFALPCWSLLLSLLSINAFARTTHTKRDDGKNHFVSQQGEQLMVNGTQFNFIGTTAYWLASLNSDEDIDFTLGNISQAGFNVVRTWAFNDVDTIPENGTWLQLIQNGTTTINEGPNGLQKLDKVMELAQKHRIYIQLSLTNNWNPQPGIDNITDPLSFFRFGRRDVTSGTNNTLPRGSLSNDYGGMDAYVRQFGGPQEHDQFFVNETLKNAFKNYTALVVSRYANHPNVLAWELANDPRCGSTISASGSCQPQDVTLWHSDLAQHVRLHDPNHIVATGHQGFLCMGCPKLFPRVVPPRPRPSPVAGTRRSPKALPLTKERILRDRKDAFKKSRALAVKSGQTESGVRIRGRWVATPTRRQQESGVGPANDGSQGVDSEDIINIPEIGLSSFMLFPDQFSYGPDDPNLPPINNTINQGLEWIRSHAEVGRLFGKPVSLAGFGLVTQGNAQSFVPFNSSVAPFGPDSTTTPGTQQQPFGITDAQRNDAYKQWIDAGIADGIQGMLQYQWSQPGLQAQDGTVISATSPADTTTPISPVDSVTGTSPNDGYGIQDAGQAGFIQSVQQAGQGFVPT